MDSPLLTSSIGGIPAESSPPGSAADVNGGAHPGMATAEVEPAQWVELAVLAELEAEVDGPELARGFARDYAAMWDQRFSRLAAAVRAQDRKAALDAVISLPIASAMVGGVRLAMLAQSLEDAIRHDDFNQGQDLLAAVAEHGISTVSELQNTYILKN
ncbi:MAG: hypothetical protein NVS2B15_12900 [Pseudarthrobacter sp.]